MPLVQPNWGDDLLFDALNSMEEALVVYDADGRLSTCNQAFIEMYSYSADQVRPGVHYRELGEIDIRRGNIVVEDDAGEDYLDRKAVYRQSLEGSFTVKLEDGRWIRTTDRPMPGGGFVSVHVDVTELKEAREKLTAAQQTVALQEKKLASLNENLEVQISERTQELEEARMLAELQARTDPLTGFKNRRAFFEAAEIIHEAAKRFIYPYTVIMIDIDQFKAVNDTHGHMAGDLVIKELTRTIEREIRSVDVAGRIGGDEFAIILPETPVVNVSILANRLLYSFQKISVPVSGAKLKVSVSIGIAERCITDQIVEDALSRADKALYQAKAKGRNQIVLA